MIPRECHLGACGRARRALQQMEVHIELHMCSMGQIRLMAMRRTCTAELPGQVAMNNRLDTIATELIFLLCW